MYYYGIIVSYNEEQETNTTGGLKDNADLTLEISRN